MIELGSTVVIEFPGSVAHKRIGRVKEIFEGETPSGPLGTLFLVDFGEFEIGFSQSYLRPLGGGDRACPTCGRVE